MKLYDSLAEWWPLMSTPSDYVEEAGIYAGHSLGNGDAPARTLVEFGSGGGNNASFLKRQFEMTLVEPSDGMRTVSAALNPECEHLPGDMRTVRLGREFDRVFIHDAIVYMTTLEDLRKAVETAYVHCRGGGAALFCPDCVRETFRPETDHGGHDGNGRALRYLEWSWDPDPSDSTCVADYVFALREEDGSVRVEHDRHVEGLFSREEWLSVLADVGFQARRVPFVHSEIEGELDLFVGVRAGK